ncbi:HlyD family type I secretion periplasmic adaptor subunit [Desulfoluna spongiiphila]|uniref:Hemolysin D n=1 Tax=Desulfoluna spongiiphila TaxID=419481 RepID=A0A1G5HVB6_9BACT|nr:HlyD family type I secretion periplasmic adaptor subunit [Desulfoluna spongiiphila]SCY67664.1 hemolysin D [Desulfoluna spongiiphila]
MMSWIRIFREAVRLEKEKEQTPREGFEVEFLPAAVEIPVSPAGRAVALSLCALFVLVLLLCIFGRMNIEAVARGKLIPLGHIKKVESLDMAKVESILVEEGQYVENGQELIRLDPTERTSDLEQVTQEYLQDLLISCRAEEVLKALRSGLPVRSTGLREAVRQVAFSDGIPEEEIRLHQVLCNRQVGQYTAQVDDYKEQIKTYQAETVSARARVKKLATLLPLYLEEEQVNRKLEDARLIDHMEWLRSKETLVNTREQLAVEESTINRCMAEISALEKRKTSFCESFLSDRLTELTEARARAARLRPAIVKAREREKNFILTAPVAGIVQQLQVHTVGAVVQPAVPLLTIVPEDTRLEVEAMVENKDIGFIKNGQAVKVKVDSFPYTKFGMIEGTVRHISMDAEEFEDGRILFPVKVSMEKQHVQVEGRPVRLSPDMSVTAEVKTGKRRVIEFFLTPFLRGLDESLKER